MARFIDHHMLVNKPMILCAMVQDSRRILLVHYIVKYYGGRKRRPDFDDKIMGALGERKANGVDPPYVVLKQSAFEWKAVKLTADTTADGLIWVWYDGERINFFNPTGNMTGTVSTNVPNMGLLPAELAVKAVKEPMLEFEEGASEGVTEHLLHTKNWYIVAAMRGTSKQCSKLGVQMTPIYDPPKKATKALEERLSGTIGRAQRAAPREMQP